MINLTERGAAKNCNNNMYYATVANQKFRIESIINAPTVIPFPQYSFSAMYSWVIHLKTGQ